MEIGRPIREYTIEPIVDPVPRDEPIDEPEPLVERPLPEPEKVPA